MNNKIRLTFQLRKLFSFQKLYRSSHPTDDLHIDKCAPKEDTLNKTQLEIGNNLRPKELLNSLLKPCKEDDLSNISPSLPPTFNLASYVNKSPILQELVKLGVDLNALEDKKVKATLSILKLDFDKDIKKYIRFLHDNGVPMDSMGKFLTKNPNIFQESLEDLEVRLNYLESKHLSKDNISTIITKNPYWLNYPTTNIDERLGYFQKKFSLTGPEVRSLILNCPRIITSNLKTIETNYFVIKEEMGFNDYEIKRLLLFKPKLWIIRQKDLMSRFDYIHNTMKISHEQILTYPHGLLNRRFRTQQRHEFLEHLGRAQYDPIKENYISLERLVTGSDQDFAINVAKSSAHSFFEFIQNK